MTEPAPASEARTKAVEQDQSPTSFAPIYTLVNNTSTRTMHHPHVHYIFSDDDPDLLTQALTQQNEANLHDSASNPTLNSRAVILDLARDADGGYNVAWASSLSPSWAVLDTHLSQISPPSSDSESAGGISESKKKKQERLMLRVEGVDGASASDEGSLRISNERSRPTSGTGSGSGSGQQKDKDIDRGEGEDYMTLVEEFDKRMNLLKKVVDAGEERRRIIGTETEQEDDLVPKEDQVGSGD